MLQYEFFRHALLTAVLASLMCGIIGTYIVARRLVFISGGITHASFGGIGIAYFFGFNPVLGAAVFALLSAFGVELITKKSGVREDSAIGIFWSFGMAVGIIFIFLSSGYTPNLMSFLFGSILTVSSNDLLMMALLSMAVTAFFVIFYNLILYISFDEDYALTKRVPVQLMNYILIGLVSLVIVLNIRVVGVILVISFLTLPQVTANMLSHHFRSIIVYSILIALLGSVGGLFVSYYADLPSGPVIICIFVLFFLVVKLVNRIIRRWMIQKALT
ncbi:MAG TPA: metal ABC transporter permease [Bacteroidales bacterium]|nr:metal ABC transporter permease [Bacteroidales bacterium]HSA42530.1 metal ABC transporter permease [Bacteroidales bacterium]